MKYLLALLTAFFIGMIIAPAIILLIKKLRVRQTILSYVEQHKEKQGIPTMGGWIFIIAATVSTLIFGGASHSFSLFIILIMLSYGIVGFLDDFLKVILKRNLGLRAYQKIISQLLIAFIASYFAYKNMYVGAAVNIPVFNVVWNMKWWYIPLSIFIYIAVTNAVNLTDGLDGLAGTTSVIYFVIFFVITFTQYNASQEYGMTLYAEELSSLLTALAALIGALAAFLWNNSYKAKIIMGDTGALALGGAVAGVAMLTKNPFLILTVGIMFVASSISVIIQVVVFKLKKKRVFLMAPLHHHFELKGYHESKIVTFYSVVTAIAGAVSLLIIM